MQYCCPCRFFLLLTLTHVLQCSNGGVELLEEKRVEVLSTAKVNDLDDVHVGDNNVLWFDVQVEDASVVKVVQTLEDLQDIVDHIILGVTESGRQRTGVYVDDKGFLFFLFLQGQSVGGLYRSMMLWSSSFPLQYSAMSTR